jgi:hypothetical protein
MKVLVIVIVNWFGCNSRKLPTRVSAPASAFEVWTVGDGALMVEQYANTTSVTDRRVVLDDLLFHTNHVLLEAADNSTELIVSHFWSICTDIELNGLPSRENTLASSGIAPFIHFRNETRMTRDQLLMAYQFLNLDKLCPNFVANNLVIRYAVVMHRLFFEAQLDNDERAIWNGPVIDNCEQVKEWFLEQSPAKLRRGVVAPISISEWIMTMDDAHRGDHDEHDFEADGRMFAISFFELEPLGGSLDRGFLAYILGRNTHNHPRRDAFVRGFHSIVSPEKLALLSEDDLGQIFEGLPIDVDSVVFTSADAILSEIIKRQDQSVLSDWVAEAPGNRRIAVGNIGRPITIRVQVDQHQTKNIARHGFWDISLSPRYVLNLE